jgi:hypothetical protein
VALLADDFAAADGVGTTSAAMPVISATSSQRMRHARRDLDRQHDHESAISGRTIV